MTDVFVIAGPTASGKSAAAVELARHVGGEIVNADAMQVYADLDLLTARPTSEEMEQAPHHLYGISDGADAWSAGRFARTAAPVIDEIMARGAKPIVVGGTGLWLKALVEGLSPIPEVSEAIVQAAEARLAACGMEQFRHEVLDADPAMASLKPADRQRHLRAWAVFHATGRPLSQWQSVPAKKLSPHAHRVCVLAPERDRLYQRCDDRFLQIMAAGATDEVRRLVERDLPKALPVMKAIGVPELSALIAGQISEAEAIATAQQATRRLAKRQMTWFRGQMKADHWALDREDVLAFFGAGRQS